VLRSTHPSSLVTTVDCRFAQHWLSFSFLAVSDHNNQDLVFASPLCNGHGHLRFRVRLSPGTLGAKTFAVSVFTEQLLQVRLQLLSSYFRY